MYMTQKSKAGIRLLLIFHVKAYTRSVKKIICIGCFLECICSSQQEISNIKS